MKDIILNAKDIPVSCLAFSDNALSYMRKFRIKTLHELMNNSYNSLLRKGFPSYTINRMSIVLNNLNLYLTKE